MPRRFWGLRRPALASQPHRRQGAGEDLDGHDDVEGHDSDSEGDDHTGHLGGSSAEDEGEMDVGSRSSDEDSSSHGDLGSDGNPNNGGGNELLSPGEGEPGEERQLNARAFEFLRQLQRLIRRNVPNE